MKQSIKLFVILLVSAFLIGCTQPSQGPPLLPTPPTPRQCTLPAGLSCASWKLHANTGELDIDVGHMFGITINVTGVVCTQKETPPSHINNYADNPITISSGSRAFISKSGTPYVIRCTDANGNPVSDMGVGSQYEGSVYINYTKLDTGKTQIASGPLWAKYEA